MYLSLITPVAQESSDSLDSLGVEFFWILLVYLAIYAVVFFMPILSYALGRDMKGGIQRLLRLLKVEKDRGLDEARDAENKLLAQIENVQTEIDNLTERRREAEMDEDVETVQDLTIRIERRNKEWERLNLDLDELQETTEQVAVDRLTNLEPLHQDYNNSFVKEAVAQLRSRYPRADYQRFELDLLPSYGAFSQRVSIARTMSGVFVLLGLLGTMLELNGVVGTISGITRNTEMEPSEFLTQMGILMQGIGGAFNNSIYGVILMVLALILVGIINKAMQRRLDKLEAAVSLDVVPVLLELHDRYMPLRGTENQLNKLNDSVTDLNDRMLGSLDNLNEHIDNLGKNFEQMLQQFGSFNQHYDLLNSWVAKLESSSQGLEGAAGEVRTSAQQLREPIHDMNRTLQQHLEMQQQYREPAFMEKILEQVQASVQATVEGNRKQMAAVQRHQEKILQEVQTSVQATVDANRQQVAAVQRHQQKVNEQVKNVADTVASQVQANNKAIAKQLKATAEVMQASTPEQLRAMLKEMQQVTNTLAKTTRDLSQTTNNLSSRLDGSANAFQDAASTLNRVSGPPTFFSWLISYGYPAARERLTGRRKGGKSRSNNGRSRTSGSNRASSGKGTAPSPKALESGKKASDKQK